MYVSNGFPQQLAEEAAVILEDISDGFFSVDVDWHVVYLNQRAERLLGVERKEAAGRTLWDLFPGLGGSDFEPVYRQAMRVRTGAEVTAYYAPHRTWYEVRIAPAAAGLSFYFRDVGAQVATQQALRDSERNFRVMADSVPQIIWIVMASGEAVYFNRQWDEYTGVPIASSTPADVANEFVHPDDREHTMAAWAQAYERHRPFDVEHRIRSKDGSYRWFLVRAEPSLDADGRIERWYGTSTDIHEEKTVKMALEVAQRRHAFQLALADRIRPLLDPEEVTAVACELLGTRLGARRVAYAEADDNAATLSVKRDWTSGGLASLAGMSLTLDDFGVPVVEILRAGRNLVVDDILLESAALPHMANYAAMGIRAVLAIPLMKDGRLRAVLSVHDDAVHHWNVEQLAMAEDMVDRTWFAVDSARAQASLREADRRKDEFLAMLAHELRNPLAPIGAAAQLLSMGRLGEDRVRHTSQIIGRQVAHMSHLIDDLLDVSRVTRGLVELDNAPLDLRQVLQDAIEQVAPLIQARRHHLQTVIAPEAALVMGDKKRLVQVVTNILNNAAKYTPEGGTITLRSALAEERVTIEIADDGIGMTPELASHVFELFAQAERSSDRSAGGLGLGLALVRSLVELHGGSVGCDSAGLGQGSRFWVSLPRLADSAAVRSGAGMAAAEPAQPALRLLVVDDNADAAAMLALVLESLGHRVGVEHDSHAALARARRERFDACILDIGLPDMDGNELAQRLRAQPESRDAVLVAVTGYGHESDRRQSLAAGFAHHLVKPADMDQLAAILGRIGMARAGGT